MSNKLKFTHKGYFEAERYGFDNLIGKKIVEIISDFDVCPGGIEYVLKLSDGTYWGVYTNEGCGGCGNGWAKILTWNNEIVDNVITNVEWEDVKTENSWDEIVNAFIFFEEKRINMTMVDEGYGNGYYGGGIGLNLLELEEH